MMRNAKCLLRYHSQIGDALAWNPAKISNPRQESGTGKREGPENGSSLILTGCQVTPYPFCQVVGERPSGHGWIVGREFQGGLELFRTVESRTKGFGRQKFVADSPR